MIPRYLNSEIDRIFSDLAKLERWQDVELAAIEAKVNLEVLPREVYAEICRILRSHPTDVEWWLKKENETKHDLVAAVLERQRFLPPERQRYYHEGLTSFDIEDPAFSRAINDALCVVDGFILEFEEILIAMAKKYRYTPMLGRTHGQWAELQTFGKRCLGWLQDLRTDKENLKRARDFLKYGKLSGAIGNYGATDPELEKETLKLLDLEPYYGATQILPREIYAPIAQAIFQIVATLNKIAVAIRLGARSGCLIHQEPFSSKQTGSSAMPHKQNTISTEQIEGMFRMALGYLIMIMLNIPTWEERAIEGSSTERIGWPDLFHVTVRSLTTMTRVLKGLRVYPDNMLKEIVGSKGTYASAEATVFLKELGVKYGLAVEEIYRIVQLAAFNAFEPGKGLMKIRNNIPDSLTKADKTLVEFQWVERQDLVSIKDIIARGELKVSAELSATGGDTRRWNDILKEIFIYPNNIERWDQVFLPSYLLRNEATLYQEILGV